MTRDQGQILIEKCAKNRGGKIAPSSHLLPDAGNMVKKRIRQDSKPLMNKLESEYFNTLILSGKYWGLKPQAMRFKLANGAWYKTDITALGYSNGHGQIIAWEIKGGKGMKGHAKSMLTLKVAATIWPEIVWILVWKQDGQWQEQRILP